jgi:DNA repair exonuclease SbcCD ATPase subunit
VRITSLKFRHVGPFGAEGVVLEGFSNGLNVVCQTNEFGKSTILEALAIFLFKPFSSARQDVKALQTAGSTEGPEGEITFMSSGRNYRLTKTFLKKKGARLQDADTGEVLDTDRAAEEKVTELLRAANLNDGPSGLLWVRQGLSMVGVKDDGQVASRLEGELGTLIGGERARDYLTRVETELATYLTKTGAAKKGGPLQVAQASVDATQAELTEAIRLRDLTKATGVELARVHSELERLESETSQVDIAAQIETTREAITAARSFANALALLSATRDQAIASAERATARQNEQIEKLVTFNATQKALDAIEGDEAALKGSLTEKRRERDELRKKIDLLEVRTAEQGRLRSRRETLARQTQRLEQTGREMARLSELLEELDKGQLSLNTLTESIADLPPVRRADIETLRRAADRMRQVEAELRALSTRLFLELSPDGAGKVIVEGRALDSGPFELSGDTVLHLDGIGRLRSDDGRLRDLSAEQVEAQSEYKNLLSQFGVTDVTQAIRMADQRHVWETDRKRLTADLARLAPQGRAALETDLEAGLSEIESLTDSLTDLGGDLVDTPECDVDIADDLRATRAKLTVIEEALEQLQAQFAKSGSEQARLRERLVGLNLPEMEDERAAQANALAVEKLKYETDARAATAKVEAMTSQAPVQPLEMLEARLKRLEQVVAQSRAGLEALKTQAAGLIARRDAAFEGEDADAKVAALEARLDHHQADLARHSRQTDIRLLLRETLTQTQSRLREAYTAPVAKELAPLLSMVIPGARAGLGDNLGVDTVHRDGRSEAITQLSGGTQEQFAILTRLAYARLLARGGASAPVILDDALVYADDGRRNAMFDVLNHVSSGEDPIQILYLSCHKGATFHLGGHLVEPKPWL